jgi:zinc D-Ala-D-Ala dipeptidase
MGLREKGAPREPGICHLNKIPIIECGEPLVNIREVCSGLIVEGNPSLLRASVARMLQTAQDSLPPGVRIKVRTTLRTLETQTRGYTNHLNSLREKHPEWPLSTLRREANKFYHPPDQKAPPGHTTGGAIDIGLTDTDGADLDTTSTVQEGIDTKPTYVRGLNPTAQANRTILIQAMSSAGFSNCADEWWHWSYGDNGWAARTGRDHAIYGALVVTPEEIAAATVEPPPAKEPESDAAAVHAEEQAGPGSELKSEAPTVSPV